MTFERRLIVFDCDGTLVDSQHLIVEAMRLSFHGAGLAAPDRAAILATVGLSMPEAISVLAPAETPVARDRLAQSYRDWCTSLRGREHDEPLFPGAAALLLDLASKNDVVLGIATGKSRRGVARFVEENGLGGIFSTIQTADDAPSKPHPAMLHQAMAEAGVTPDMTVMIGDTSYDMMMAVYAKVRGIGVSWGYHSGAELHKYGAMAVMKSFSALESDLHGFLNVRRYEAVA